MTDRATQRARAKRQKQRRTKAILLADVALLCIGIIVWGLVSLFSQKPMPIIYHKDGMLLVKPDKADEPFIVSKNFLGAQTDLTKNGKGIVYIDADNNLCYNNLKNSDTASKTSILAGGVSAFAVPNDKLIYYIRIDVESR